MTYLMVGHVYFYYIAVLKSGNIMGLTDYISEIYLFVVANNVCFIKRFAGL